MLVLARRVNEKIVFPTIGASVQVVAVKPGVVRLGVEAPEAVPVFREEVLDRKQAAGWEAPPADPAAADLLREVVRQFDGRLRADAAGLTLLRQQLAGGRVADAAATIARLEGELGALQRAVDGLNERLEHRPRRRRALLVEDDRNECELLAGFLRLAGLDVETAGDGADALDYLRRGERPDVVLLDMIMPRVDGPTTVRAIRGDPALAGLKIFGVTGAAHDRYGLADGPGGIDRWFRKPLNPEALLLDLRRDLGPERP
jgi:carbon storage regulator CsrA